ncbi:MAG: hypothetical protein GX998_05465 [Firmicutes bacterium]|nr:hypothetical protein [Bacillota bacterium]
MIGPAAFLRKALVIGFLVLIAGALYWQVGQRQVLVAHPANPQYLHQWRSVHRGGIFDRRGEVISESLQQPNGFQRVYRGTSGLAPIIGYCSQRYGTAGLEKAFNGVLMGQQYPGVSVIGRIRHLLSEQASGYALNTTLDLSLQRSVERAFAGRKGAAVVMEVKTGRILAMASLPGFDPNDLEAKWLVITADANSPLYNRALAGFYPPGSTFKLIVLAAGLALDTVELESWYDDYGSIMVEGHQIANANHQAWGRISLLDGLAVSSNVVFVEVARQIGSENLLQMASSFGLGRKPPLVGGSASGGRLPAGELSSLELAQMAIGQYGLITTPLQMAIVAQTIANDGLMMQPLLVESVQAPRQNQVWVSRPQPARHVISAQVARQIRVAMAESVIRGTGQKAALSTIKIAGKTGSAENPQGPAHAWFVGMAPVTRPAICLAVVVENGGSGGSVAAPIAREVFRAYFEGRPSN